MRQLSLTLLPLLVLTGCDPDSEPVGQSDAGGTDSGSDGDSEDSAPGSTSSDSASATSPETSDSATTVDNSTSGTSSTGDPGETSGSGGSSGGECEEADCGPCPDGTTLEQYCDSDTWVCDCVPVGSVCDLPTYVDEAAMGKTVPVDCGTVTQGDPDEAYQAAHDCVVAASDSQQAYRMVAQLDGIDSSVWVGYAGTVGFVYGESNFAFDGGGFSGVETIWRMDCTPEVVADCVPSRFGMCLSCMGENNLVCSSSDE